MNTFDCRELKKLREYLDWSIPYLVERLKSVGMDVSERTIGNWENGHTAPGADDLAKIAGLFGVGIERFYPSDK